MCTAATYKTKDFYFGRTLDNDFSYAEEVTVSPRNYHFAFRTAENLPKHFAIIGTAFVPENFPLYYDAVNEKGLCMAGLNFVGGAHYKNAQKDKINLAQFEFIPFILGKCADVDGAVSLIKNVNITPLPYNDRFPVALLHWLVADRNKAVTVEFTADGLKIYDNPVGVLTNDPPFCNQMFNLNNYMGLSPKQPENTFSDKLPLKLYSRGMGAIGLPGDLSSQSRFVRAAFVRNNSISGDSEEESVNQFFHILGSVEQQRGCSVVGKDGYEITVYTSCCNADKGIYYYTTYENHCITAIELHNENLDSSKLFRYPFTRREIFVYGNR